MEPCPNCGQLSRLGARFCTICGHKLATDDAEASVTPNVAILEPSDAPSSEDRDESASASNGGWPTAPTIAEGTPENPWVDPPATTTSNEEATADKASGEEPSSFWSAGPTGTWPSPSSVAAEEPPADTVGVASEAVMEDESVDVQIAADSEGDAARDRATRLLDELREAIAAISGEEPRNFSGVISELEVAVTPPGAMDSEALNELREALLKARERPRDIDTIVDLTGRLDAMVALSFAYDRTVAAIERALEVLRGDG